MPLLTFYSTKSIKFIIALHGNSCCGLNFFPECKATRMTMRNDNELVGIN